MSQIDRVRAKRAFLAQLDAYGVDRVFGNPGTFEQGWLDALAEFPKIRYVMGLQESVVAATAIVHAKLTRRPAVVQLHAGVGLGNAMGMLLEARRSGVPLVVYAGENSTRDEPLDGYLATDLLALASPTVIKWSARASSAEHVPHLFRRAWSEAESIPRGPTLLAVPMDVLEREIVPDVRPLLAPAPPSSVFDVGRIASDLAGAARPLILIGDAVAWDGADPLVAELADRLAAPVFGLNHSMLGSWLARPWYGGVLGPIAGAETASVTRRADVVLSLGATLATEIFPLAPADYLAPNAIYHQADPDPCQVGRTTAPTSGWVGPMSPFVAALNDAVGHPRRAPWFVGDPLRIPDAWSTPRAMAILAETIPDGTVLIDEGITASPSLRAVLAGRSVEYLAATSRCLGVGWPGGVSAKLAHPDRPVLSLSGDGAAMYVPSALWTAAREGLKVVFIAWANRSYDVLKLNLDAHRQLSGEPGRSYPPMFDLAGPAVDFVRLAEAQGVVGFRADDEASLRRAMNEAWSAPGPALVEVRVPGVPNPSIRSLGEG